MAYIKCTGGGKGANDVEVIIGKMNGHSGATSGGKITITSDEGKAPKRVQFLKMSDMCWLVWNSYLPDESLAKSGSAIGSKNVGDLDGVWATIFEVGTDYVTLACPTSSTYYAGVWRYYVEFE